MRGKSLIRNLYDSCKKSEISYARNPFWKMRNLVTLNVEVIYSSLYRCNHRNVDKTPFRLFNVNASAGSGWEFQCLGDTCHVLRSTAHLGDTKEKESVT